MASSKRRPSRIPGHEAIYLSQRTNFDVKEYEQYPSMIRKLHEERELAHAYSDKLERLLEDKINVCAELERGASKLNFTLSLTISQQSRSYTQ